jgi:hypothetical protein
MRIDSDWQLVDYILIYPSLLTGTVYNRPVRPSVGGGVLDASAHTDT